MFELLVAPAALDLPMPEVVESYSRSLGVAGALVILVLGYVFLRRRAPDTDLMEHEKTKRELVSALVDSLRATRSKSEAKSEEK